MRFACKNPRHLNRFGKLSRRGAPAAAVLVLLACTLPAESLRADVLDYAFGKALQFEQTADNTAPTTPSQAMVFGNLFVDNPGDFGSVSLSGGAGLTYSSFFGGFDWLGEAVYATQAEMDAAFPNAATYTLSASGGTLGTFNETITFGVSQEFPNTPFFTGSVVSDAQGMNASSDFTFSWNIPPSDGYQLFIEEVNGPEVFNQDGVFGGTETSATVSGGTFAAGTTYRAVIAFFDVEEGTRSSFPTGIEYTGFITETSFVFSTAAIPEPSTLALLVVAVPVMTRRRRS